MGDLPFNSTNGVEYSMRDPSLVSQTPQVLQSALMSVTDVSLDYSLLLHGV